MIELGGLLSKEYILLVVSIFKLAEFSYYYFNSTELHFLSLIYLLLSLLLIYFDLTGFALISLLLLKLATFILLLEINALLLNSNMSFIFFL